MWQPGEAILSLLVQCCTHWALASAYVHTCPCSCRSQVCLHQHPTDADAQAAATGETLVDGQLSRLATDDPTKLLRLNQRMQAGAGATQRQRPVLRGFTPGAGTSAAGGAQRAAARARNGTRPQQTLCETYTWNMLVPFRTWVMSLALRSTHTGAQVECCCYLAAKPNMAVSAGLPHAVPAVTVAAEFPPAQRPYILFLATVDSHRLNAAVTRCAPAQGCRHSESMYQQLETVRHNASPFFTNAAYSGRGTDITHRRAGLRD